MSSSQEFPVPDADPAGRHATRPPVSEPGTRAAARPATAAGVPWTRRAAPAMPLPCADLRATLAALAACLGPCRRQHRQAAVLWVGVDVDEADGGRSLMQAMGQRLRHRVRATDGVLQHGSAGFVVLLVDAGELAAAGVSERLGEVLRGPYRLDGGYAAPRHLRLGQALLGRDGFDAAVLLPHAIAMAGRQD